MVETGRKKTKEKEIYNLPIVMLPQENKVIITEFIDELIKLLKDKKLFYRIADDSIIEICDNKLKIVTPTRMVSLIESVCVPCVERWNEYAKCHETHKRTTSEQVCKVLLASPVLHNNLRKIEKILFTPVPILKNGKLTFPKRGYNEDLKLYLDENAPEINESNMKLDEAKKILFEIFEEFCFKQDRDSIKSLLGLITPFLRGLYKDWNTRTPVFIYFANRERAGKDYLATIRGLLFEGQAIEEPPICTGKSNNSQNEELRKKILASLSIGRQFLHFSNNKGFINNSVLEQITTTKVFSDRILGGNKIATFPNNLEISLSGNIGTTLTSDLNYRSIIINLFLAMENVNEREFKRPNLHHYIEENRSKILSVLYLLVKNWYDNGMKKSEILFSSFSEWAAICGGIIEAAGFSNPLEKKDDVDNITIDRELNEMKNLFEYLHEKKANLWIKKNEIKNIIREDEEIEIFPYLDFSQRSDQIKFGFLLDKYKGRELSGIKMIVDETIKTKHKRKYKFTMEDDVEEKQLELSKTFGVDEVVNVVNVEDV